MNLKHLDNVFKELKNTKEVKLEQTNPLTINQ